MEKQKTGSGEQHDGLEKDHCAVFVWKEIIKMQKEKNLLHKYTYRIIIMHNYSENIQLYASAPTKTCREEQLRSLFLTWTGRKADWDPTNYDREEKRL